MCKSFLALLLFVFVSALMRLEAQQLNYQAIARNANGVALTFRDVGIRLSIRDGSQTGSIVYSETRNVRTNQFGLFTVVIGSPGASNVMGSMASINWISGNKYLQVEIDPEGGNNYFQAGTSQLQAVPYALFANAAYPVGPAGGDLLGSNYPNPIIAPLAVTTGKIANQAITTPKIADLNVTTAKLADQAITNPKIQDNTISNIKLVNSKVTLNGLILNLGDEQDFAVGTAGTDVNIISAGKTHTFNFPDASIANRGLITPNTQTIGGNKTFNNNVTAASFIKAGGIAAQFLKADGSVDNNTYLTANQPIIVTATGDATGVSTSSGTAPVLPLTLATVNSAVGTFGNNITVPSITVNNKGLVTNVTANPIPTATATTNGLLTVGDWNTFNNKQNAIPLGTSTQYFRGDLTLGDFTTDVRNQISAGTNITYANGNIGLTNNSVTINSLPLALGGSQSFATGSSGSDFNISSAGTVHSFNIPTASATNRGLLSSADFTNFNTAYTSRITGLTTTGSNGPATLSGNVLNIPNYTLAGLGGISNTTSLNGLALSSSQTFTSGNTGSDFNIVSTGTTHTFNIPNSTASTRGLLSSTDWSVFNNKQNTISGTGYGKWSGSNINFTTQIPLGTDVSGTLLAGNFGQLTGDITNPPGSYATTITNNAITTAKIADGNVSNAKLENKGITINGLNVDLGGSQLFGAGSSGTDFNISSIGSTHTFNLPSSSATTRGLLTSTDWSTFNSKQTAISGTGYGKWNGSTISFNSQIPLGTDVSGTLLAGNFGQLTGDVSNAPGSYATTIANDAITTVKIADANVTNAKLVNKSITLNGLAVDLGSSQSFASGSTGSDFNIVSSGSTHTFHLPSSSATARGLLTSADWTSFNGKQNAISGTGYAKWNGSSINFNTQIPLGTDVSGTLLAGNFGQLTGDVTNAPGSYATTIANDAITTAKILDGAVTNAKLASNGSFTLGSTNISLGNTVTTVAGLTLSSPVINTPSIYYTNTPTGLTAGVNSQGSLNLTNDINVITTAAASSAVTLPAAQAGRQIIIVNRGANPINVYPASSAQINDLATNAAFSNIPANSYAEFFATSSSQWYSANSIATATSSWNILGNSGTSETNNFVGTTDAKTLKFRVNNTFAGQINKSLSVGNTSFGFDSNDSDGTGDFNSAFGTQALNAITVGHQNSGFGAGALAKTNSGNDNTAVGQGALFENLTGDNNTGIGQGALTSNQTGTSNVAVGQASLRAQVNINNNTAVGRAAIENITSGANNTVLGYIAGRNFGTTFSALGTDITNSLSQSVMIGSQSRPSASGSQNEIVIGYDAYGAGNNTVQLGNTSITKVNTSGSMNAAKFIGNNSGTSLTHSSGIIDNVIAPTLSGNDVAGFITFTTGPVPVGTGNFITVTFGSAYSGGNPVVIIQPVSNTAPRGIATSIYCLPSATLTGSFIISTGATLLANTEYQIAYHVIGRE